MDQGRTGERRTRDLSWGDARARALMHALARDAATRAGFRVCAIEVVRPKGLLEFVAIYGDLTSSEERLGTASRLSDMQALFEHGEPFGQFLWIPDEAVSEATRELIDGVVVVPDIPTTGDPADWHPMDMLVAQITDERGDLRALLYLDVPTDLRRPDKERLLEISDELAMTLRSIVTLVEREEFADHMRVIRATRRLARSNPARHDVGHLLSEARSTLLGALSVDELEIRLFMGDDSAAPDSLGLGIAREVRRALDAAAARAWAEQRVLIIEPGQVWGDAELAAYAGWFTDALRRAGFEAVVVAPVGVDDEVLGMLMCARRTGSRRWTDGEAVAALELGHDLGRAIANAHATQRERRLLEELRALEESRHRFLRELTHEINNPMTVIVANAELLATSELVDERDLRRARAILRGSERLGDLLQGLATLWRVSDPQRPPTMQHVDLVPIVEETLAAMTAVAGSAWSVAPTAASPSAARTRASASPTPTRPPCSHRCSARPTRRRCCAPAPASASASCARSCSVTAAPWTSSPPSVAAPASACTSGRSPPRCATSPSTARSPLPGRAGSSAPPGTDAGATGPVARQPSSSSTHCGTSTVAGPCRDSAKSVAPALGSRLSSRVARRTQCTKAAAG